MLSNELAISQTISCQNSESKISVCQSESSWISIDSDDFESNVNDLNYNNGNFIKNLKSNNEKKIDELNQSNSICINIDETVEQNLAGENTDWNLENNKTNKIYSSLINEVQRDEFLSSNKSFELQNNSYISNFPITKNSNVELYGVRDFECLGTNEIIKLRNRGTEENQIQFEKDQLEIEENQPEIEEISFETEENNSKTEENQPEIEENQLEIEEYQLEIEENQLETENELEIEENSYETEENNFETEENQLEIEEYQLEIEENLFENENQPEIEENQLETGNQIEMEDYKFETEGNDQFEKDEECCSDLYQCIEASTNVYCQMENNLNLYEFEEASIDERTSCSNCHHDTSKNEEKNNANYTTPFSLVSMSFDQLQENIDLNQSHSTYYSACGEESSSFTSSNLMIASTLDYEEDDLKTEKNSTSFQTADYYATSSVSIKSEVLYICNL